MPWLESCAMDERVRFVGECLSGEGLKMEVCEACRTSRKAGYKWLARYEVDAAAGLADRLRAPHVHGRATPVDLVDLVNLVEKIVDLRRARPTWGPRKILARLEPPHPELDWPG